MSKVDSRIVELGFNNKQFESGVSESLKSIEALKKGLTFDKTAKSLGDLEKQEKDSLCVE